LNSNNPPEIFEIHKSWTPMFSKQIYPLPKTIMTTDQFKKEFYSVISDDLVRSEGLMAMPLYYDGIALYINQEILTRAAASPPETWMEFEELATKFNQKGRNNLLVQTGVPMGYSQNVDYWQEVVALLMYQNGADLVQPEGERAKAAINFYSSFRNKGVWDTRLPSSTDFFAQGSAAMYFGPTNEASYIINQNPGLRFRTVLLPQIPKGDPDDPDFSYSTYYAHSVSAGSGDRDSAWKLLKYLTEREQLIQLNANREEKGLYPRIYPRSSMANLQNADPILGSVVALIPQSHSWYLNDDQIEGNTSLTDQVSEAYSGTVFGDRSLKGLSRTLKDVLSKYGIRVN
ncbi:MAG TPA: extracellular solute-binding protein, partial [Bacteroidales bacterium]|nr:extracellular solute-binding protein [Bacteroidales bacterium]